MKKTNFFDAEFECELLKLSQQDLSLRLTDFISHTKICGCIFMVVSVFCLIVSGHQMEKMEKVLKSVQQEQVQMSCEMEANKMGVGYTFINKGKETECLLHYVD